MFLEKQCGLLGPFQASVITYMMDMSAVLWQWNTWSLFKSLWSTLSNKDNCSPACWVYQPMVVDRLQNCLRRDADAAFVRLVLFLGMHPSFRTEQIPYPLPGKQADPGAERLFHRNKLKDLYGEYVHDTHNCLWVLQFNWIAACFSRVRGLWSQRASVFCKKSYTVSSFTHLWWLRSKAAEPCPVLVAAGLQKSLSYSESTAEPDVLSKGHCFLWRLQLTGCTQSQWTAGYQATGMSHGNYKEK